MPWPERASCRNLRWEAERRTLAIELGGEGLHVALGARAERWP